MSRRKRRVFTEEQKAAAVEHVRSTGKTVGEAARDLDLTETALRRWVIEAQARAAGSPGEELAPSEREELRRLRRENQRLQMERGLPKKSRSLLCQGDLGAFELIEAEKAHFPVRLMCSVLEVSPSGYYAWRQRPVSKRKQEREKLKVAIHAAHRAGRGTYGSPRVTQELKYQGVQVGRHRVARLMREHKLQGTPRRRFRVTTTSDPALAVVPNHLARQFQVPQPDQIWTADLTYLWTQEGWLYLAVVLDLCSRRVVGWSLAGRAGDSAGFLRKAECQMGRPSGFQLTPDGEDRIG